eukprot:gene36867-48081_t
MRKWIGTMFIVVIAVLAGCGGGGGGGGGIGLGPGFGGTPAPTAQKIIIDSDYNTMSDDGQLGVMAAQLQAQGKVQVMGISVVSGNQWLKQGVADALAQVRQQSEGDVLLVSSGGPISTAVGQVLGLSPEATIELNLRIRNSAVTEFQFNPKRHTLLTYNTLPHLDHPDHKSWVTYA